MMTSYCSSLVPLCNWSRCRTVMKSYRHGVFKRRQEGFRFRFIPTGIPFSFYIVYKQSSCQHRVNEMPIRNDFVPFSNHTGILSCERGLKLSKRNLIVSVCFLTSFSRAVNARPRVLGFLVRIFCPYEFVPFQDVNDIINRPT